MPKNEQRRKHNKNTLAGRTMCDEAKPKNETSAASPSSLEKKWFSSSTILALDREL